MIGDCGISQYLLRLAAGHSAGERQALAASLVDLLTVLETDLNEREAALIGDILSRLVRDFEPAVRCELAHRLAGLELAPRKICVTLANDDIAVARPMLQHSPALHDQDLIAIVRERSRQHRLSIARRESLSEAVADALVETGEETVITSLLGNAQARMSPAARARLVEDARRVVSYQAPLALRRDVGGDLLQTLRGFVSHDLRGRLRQRFDPAAPDRGGDLDHLPDLLVADTVQNIRDRPAEDAPADRARCLADASEVTPELLIGILQDGRTDLFEALIGKVTGLDTYALRHVLYDPNGKALATICRAMDIPRKQFVELYLLVLRSPAASERTPAREISAVVRHYDRITPRAALEALAAWRGDDRPGVAEGADSNTG